MKKIFTVIAILLSTITMILTSCSTDSPDNNPSTPVNHLLTVDIPDNQWTYVSLKSGAVVGTCALGDSAAVDGWSRRTDWDIALCNGVIRTNSGKSGAGRGGITVSSSAYDDTQISPSANYSTDSNTVRVEEK